jgi:hypothetical protein
MPWITLSFDAPILPVHAALLPPGGVGNRSKVLFFAGSGNNPRDVPTNFTDRTRAGSTLWDYANPAAALDPNGSGLRNSFTTVNLPEIDNVVVDVFCAGQSILPNGSVLVAGGTEFYDDEATSFVGKKTTLIFDRSTEAWINPVNSDMADGRWYPTQLTLGDGRVLIVSGTDSGGLNQNNQIPEIYANGTWTQLPQTTSNFTPYSHLVLLLNGDVFYSGSYFFGNGGVSPRILSLTPINGELPETEVQDDTVDRTVDPNAIDNTRDQAACVILPPAQNQRIMVAGGGVGGDTTDTVKIIDLNSATPTYTFAAPLNQQRKHHYGILLPDRTVFVCGGGTSNEKVGETGLEAEIYNPSTNTWTVVPGVEGVPRLYHSTALLLPNGSVVSAGGNPERLNMCIEEVPSTRESDNAVLDNGQITFTDGITLNCQELRLTVYRPAYMTGARPNITNAPASVVRNNQSDSQFTIMVGTTAQVNQIKWVHLIRPMAMTHSCDVEQRLIDLPITGRVPTNRSLTVRLDKNRNLAPNGWYMLFVVTTANIPSVARWIQIL